MVDERQQIYDFISSAVVASGTSIYVESFLAAVCAGIGTIFVRYAAEIIKKKFFK
tara:strand:+ start:484 stop:648 length:165 start_codon:yes stop_codon:yes gene_type:complete